MGGLNAVVFSTGGVTLPLAVPSVGLIKGSESVWSSVVEAGDSGAVVGT